MAVNEQKRALYYYLANQEAINQGHLGEYVAISNNKVVAYYRDVITGTFDMVDRGYKIGSFNVNECTKPGEAAVQMGFIPIIGDPL
jgi:hypothetical protein